ncbi:MAG: cation:proton antiporter [Candidatus Thorarchaeota archaeon]
MDFVLLIGLALLFAFIGAMLLKRIGFPQIVGFMIAGIVLAQIGILNEQTMQDLHFIVNVALGLIGYNIGLELREIPFEKKVRKNIVIVLFSTIAAFTAVFTLVFLISGQFILALLLAGLASATAPAATSDVIWENQCEGPVSETLIFVLAIDDIIAVITTGATIAFSLWFYAPELYTLASVALTPLIEIALSLFFGISSALIFTYVVNRMSDRGYILEFKLGVVFVLIGLSQLLHFSPIFVSIVFGYIVGSKINKDVESMSHLVQRIMSPIVMIFFVIVGGKMNFSLFFSPAGIIVIVLAVAYIVGISAKSVGTFVGATIVKSPDVVRKYLGPCLLCQAGVALGLGFLIQEQFQGINSEAAAVGTLLLSVVGVSTMILELVGPLSIKWALGKAGEIPIHGELFAPHDWIVDERQIFDELGTLYDAETSSTGDVFDGMSSLYDSMHPPKNEDA